MTIGEFDKAVASGALPSPRIVNGGERWSDIRGDEISVVQDKTSLALTIALHRDLAALLAKRAMTRWENNSA